MSVSNEHPAAEAEDALSLEALHAEVERLKKLCDANNIKQFAEDEDPNVIQPVDAPMTAAPPTSKTELVTDALDHEELKTRGRGYHLLQEAAKAQNEHEAKLSEALGTGSLSALPLLRQVTKATFLEAVRENMENFDMSEDEARQEAVDQFKQQGVDATHLLSATPDER